MKTKIIYTAPSDKVFTYTTSHPVKINESIVEFYDEIDKAVIKLPFDRCQVVEVQ